MARTVKSGFRIDVSQAVKKLRDLKGRIKASLFKPEIQNNLLRPALNAAKRNTPVRDLVLIREAQIGKGGQYDQWASRAGTHGVTRAQFLADRAPARFLFQLSWVQVGDSLGVNVTASNQVLSATTRNHDEPEIPRGYGQWRGGGMVLTAVIYNPFLAGPARKYKPFVGEEIIGAALIAQKPVFDRAVERKLKRTIHAVFA